MTIFFDGFSVVRHFLICCVVVGVLVRGLDREAGKASSRAHSGAHNKRNMMSNRIDLFIDI